MEFKFAPKKAAKKRARLRLALEGPAGGGKTYTAIKIAKYLIGEPIKCDSSKILVCDTERNSAELYADEFDFMHQEIPMQDCSPTNMIAMIRAAERAGMEVIILDSITHEWTWCIQQVDLVKVKMGGNQWAAWGQVKPQHEAFIDTIMGSSAHVISTMRSKMKTKQTEEGSKKKVEKIGLQAVQSDDLDYSFTVVMAMDADHNGVIGKTRCRGLDGKVFQFPGEEMALILRDWLNSGDASAEAPVRLATPATQSTTAQTSSAPGGAPRSQEGPPVRQENPAAKALREASTVEDAATVVVAFREKIPAERQAEFMAAVHNRVAHMLAIRIDAAGSVEALQEVMDAAIAAIGSGLLTQAKVDALKPRFDQKAMALVDAGNQDRDVAAE